MTASERRENRRKGGAAEERKRGQRLFGALLGTLSQSSSSAAQKRRDDIEKKQQTKLKQQAQEYDELKRTKHTELVATRRKEQEVYDRQSVGFLTLDTWDGIFTDIEFSLDASPSFESRGYGAFPQN